MFIIFFRRFFSEGFVISEFLKEGLKNYEKTTPFFPGVDGEISVVALSEPR